MPMVEAESLGLKVGGGGSSNSGCAFQWVWLCVECLAYQFLSFPVLGMLGTVGVYHHARVKTDLYEV